MTNLSMLEAQAKTQTKHMLGICINLCMYLHDIILEYSLVEVTIGWLKITCKC